MIFVVKSIVGLTAIFVSVGSLAAPITFNTALPVGEGRFINREQVVVMRSGTDPSGARREVNISSLQSVLAYGVSSKLALFGALPYVDKELRLASGTKRSSNSFGDLVGFGRYTAYARDRPGRTFRIAGVVGVKAPTGKDDESDAIGRLPIPLQSGTGAWDVFGAGVISYQSLNLGVDSQILYRANGAANDYEIGDEIRLDASLQYRLLPKQLDASTFGFLYGVLESNVIHRKKDKLAGQSSPDTGGTTVFITPGLQYATRKVILETAIQIPVSQNLNGDGLENDFIFRMGFRVNY